MKAYLNLFKIRIINELQYRAAAIAGISTQFFFGFVFAMVYLALYESNKGINPPMNLSNLITYLWLQQAFYALTYPHVKDKELLKMIENGNLAYELIRPQNFYLKIYIKQLAHRFVAALLRCLPIIIVGFLLPYPYKLAMPNSLGNLILFILALLFSCFLVTSLSIIVHIITMYFLDPRGIQSAYTILTDVFMGAIVPLPFFPKILKGIAYMLPFRYINDFPYRVYSGDISIIEGKTLLLNSLIWIIISVISGELLSKHALKKAVIQGG